MPTRASKNQTLSSLVRHMAQVLPKDEDLTIGQVFHFLGVHGFIFFILVLAILNIVIFMLPGFSFFFGAAMVILAVQMILDLPAPIVPDAVRDYKIKNAPLQKGLAMVVRALETIEKGIKPRLSILSAEPWLMRAHSVLALFLSLMVAIPVPVLNLPPTIGIICLSVGLMQKDGYFIISGYLFAGWSFWLYQSLHKVAVSIF